MLLSAPQAGHSFSAVQSPYSTNPSTLFNLNTNPKTPSLLCSYAAPDRSNRRSSLSTDFSFGVSEDSSLPNLGLPPMAPSQERLKQQQYMRQQFIQQQQEERRRSGSLPLSEQQWDPRGAADGSPVRQNSASSMTPDKSQQLHSAPIRSATCLLVLILSLHMQLSLKSVLAAGYLAKPDGSTHHV